MYMTTLKTDKSRPVPGFGNPKCYAHGLLACSVRKSGEPGHQSIIELVGCGRGKKSNFVSVKKSSFQERGAKKTLGTSSLAGNILRVSTWKTKPAR